MELTALILLGTLATKFIDFGKYLQNKDWNGALTQLSVWVAGILVIFMASNASTFDSVMLPAIDTTIGGLDFWGQVIIGLSITSLLSTVYDFKKALDSTDSASIPALFPHVQKAPITPKSDV